MCDFVDMNGVALNPEDHIEYWGVDNDWIRAVVKEVKTVRTASRNVTKIRVSPDSNQRYAYSGVTLSKSANVRKV